MSRRKPFWHVTPQYYAGVLVGSVASALTDVVLCYWYR